MSAGHLCTGAAQPLTDEPITTEKTIVIVRHGLATWSAAGRIQAGFYVIVHFRQPNCMPSINRPVSSMAVQFASCPMCTASHAHLEAQRALPLHAQGKWHLKSVKADHSCIILSPGSYTERTLTTCCKVMQTIDAGPSRTCCR